jgi:hypothetical protein
VLALALGLAFVYRPLFSGQLIVGRDGFRLFIPDSSFLLEALKAGELPLWNPYPRLGQPFAATLYAQAFYPPQLLSLLAGPLASLTVRQVLHAALAAAGAWWLCRRLRTSRPAALLAGAAFGLSPLLTALAPQQNVVDAAAWTGFIGVAARALARRPSARAVAWLALPAGLSFLAGSPETLLWQSLLALGLGLDARDRRRALAGTALGLAWAFGLGALVGLPGLELAARSARAAGFTEQLRWSVSPPQLLSMGWPFADHPRVGYQGGDQWFLVCLFLGTGVVALAGVGLGRWRRAPALAAGFPLLALLSLGSHFPPAAWLLRLPPFGLFRYPAKYYVGAAFCAAVLAALGLDRVAALARRVGPSVTGLALALLAAFALLATGRVATRLPLFRSGAEGGWLWVVVALLLLAVAFFLVPAGPARPRRLRGALAAIAVLELGAFHGVQVDPGWRAPGPLSRPSRLAALLPQPFPGRISVELGGPEPDLYKSPPRRTLELSRDALVPNRFVEEHLRALEGYGAPEPADEARFHLSGERALYDLTGVSYFIRNGPPPFADLERLPTPPELPSLYRSRTALPRAFVVHRAVIAPGEAALAALRSADQPGRATVYLARGTPLEGSGCPGSTARIAREGLQWLELRVDSCAPGYLVLSESYAPGWRAELDGERVPLLRADVALRAIPVPPGSHRVTLRYLPWSFVLGAALAAFSWLALGLVLRCAAAG